MSDNAGGSHRHHHNHHHEHSHSHGEMSVRDKLEKLLDHWQHHNEDHAKSFEEWEKKAREEGLVDVAKALAKAAELTRGINTELSEALEKIKSK